MNRGNNTDCGLPGGGGACSDGQRCSRRRKRGLFVCECDDGLKRFCQVELRLFNVFFLNLFPHPSIHPIYQSSMIDPSIVHQSLSIHPSIIHHHPSMMHPPLIIHHSSILPSICDTLFIHPSIINPSIIRHPSMIHPSMMHPSIIIHSLSIHPSSSIHP